MGHSELLAVLLTVACASAQISRVCVPPTENIRCQNLNNVGSLVSCETVTTRVECAARLARNAADVGLFSEEEVLLLSQMPNNNDLRVIASVRDVSRQTEEFAFESVVVVPSNHTGGFEGLRGGRYCHPGLGVPDIRWSPRVLRALEVAAARTDRCEGNTAGRTAEELEAETLSNFFSAACRPGPWSSRPAVDLELKSRYPNLCSLCSGRDGDSCAGYNTDQMINIAGVQNSNRHIQALECLRVNGSVAYVAWQHVREFFMTRNPEAADRYSLLCENGTLAALTPEALSSPTSPCSLVRQPWSAIVATAATADAISANLRLWWPQSADPGGNTWQSSLYGVLAGGSTVRVNFEATPLTPLNYTSRYRSIASIDATSSCLPAVRWCTVSALEQTKCQWTRAAAYSVGLQPAISCQQRSSVFDCLADAQESRVDFFSLDSHYGYLARRRYQLNAIKLVVNNRGYTSRVAALVKESNISNISRFANLKDDVACFPEYGGLGYVAFLRTAHQHSVISDSQCDYARAVGEFFSGACAPGATYTSHTISDDSAFSVNSLCSACRLANETAATSNFTCAYNTSNLFFGNRGSLRCLNAPHTDVAFVELQNINAQLTELGINPNTFRVLCANDTLAVNPGVEGIDDNCLLTHVVDAEVLMRRNDQLRNSTSALLDALDEQFGYNTVTEQLVNLHLFSPFDGVSDLLFKDSTIGLTEPSTDSIYATAKNYIELFQHLESCNSAASPPVVPGGHASRNLVSVLTFAVMGIMARFVVY